jgi:phosphate starvation-inducible PhoH-like protein
MRKTEKATIPWSNPAEPEAPYHPSSKLAVLKVSPRSPNQRTYLEAIDSHDMVFGIGPAGSGKTFLAVAKALQWLAKKGNRLILTRPAVEAGEKLGFLPGSMQEKVDPYLRPIYDALYELMEPQRVDAYLERGIIEVAPLAFMRGRTLNNAFVILDEAQNTTPKQIKMLLTRMGANAKVVVTGDITQIDLPSHQESGLMDARRILEHVNGIHFQYFNETDIVRHPLVREICKAYDEDDEKA